MPIVLLAILAFAGGFFNPTPLGEQYEHIKTYVEPRPTPVIVEEYLATGPGESVDLTPSVDDGDGDEGEEAGHAEEEGGHHDTGCGFDTPEAGTACFFPTVTHAEPTLAKILLSLAVVAIGYIVAIAFNVAFYGKRNKRLVGLTERSKIMRGGFLFLKNKYYLDALYEGVIVHGRRPPDRQGRQLGQPERHRRPSSTRSARAPGAPASGSTTTSTRSSSTARSTDPARRPRAPATQCNLSSRARCPSTARCCSALPRSAPSSSSSST